MKNKEIVKEGYNKIADKYLLERNKDSEDVKLIQELIKHLPKGAKVLDAGCGAGDPVTKILSKDFQVTGVDFAEAQIKLARNLIPNAQFICKDMIELDFPDNSFDAICSYYAIIHIPREEHKKLLLNFYRMLKPSGLVLLCMGAGDLQDDIEENYLGAEMYWSHYDADTNIKMLIECGFSIIWAKLIKDESDPNAVHLFVLGRKE